MSKETTVEDLIRQQTAVNMRIGALQSEIDTRTAELESVDKALDEVIRSELRGIATAADLASATAALDQARASLDSARRLCQLARQEALRVDRELMEARALERNATLQRVRTLSDAIEARIKKDAKLRADLLQIYGLWSAYNVSAGGADWDLIVSDVFGGPTDEEHRKAVDDGLRQLGIQA